MQKIDPAATARILTCRRESKIENSIYDSGDERALLGETIYERSEATFHSMGVS